jgi:hypothetical protein
MPETDPARSKRFSSREALKHLTRSSSGTAQCRSDLSKNLVADCNYQSHFIIRNSNGSLKLQMGSGTDGAGMDHVPPVPLRAVSLAPSSALRRCGEQETGLSTQLAGGFSWWCSGAIGPYWRVAMILTAIVLTGLVFTGLGAGIGYVLGYIEAENYFRIKHGEKP